MEYRSRIYVEGDGEVRFQRGRSIESGKSSWRAMGRCKLHKSYLSSALTCRSTEALVVQNGDAVSRIYTGANALFTRVCRNSLFDFRDSKTDVSSNVLQFIRTGHYSPGQQTFDNFVAMEKRNVQHYTRDHSKNRAMELLTVRPRLSYASPIERDSD